MTLEDLETLRSLLAKYEVWYQWTGPHSTREEPWKQCSGFTFHNQLRYELRPRNAAKPDSVPTISTSKD